MVGDILSSGLGSIWYGMMWFCRYLDDFGYSITNIAFGLHILFQNEEGTTLAPTKLPIWFDCLFDLKYSRKVTSNSYINGKLGPIR